MVFVLDLWVKNGTPSLHLVVSDKTPAQIWNRTRQKRSFPLIHNVLAYNSHLLYNLLVMSPFFVGWTLQFHFIQNAPKSESNVWVGFRIIRSGFRDEKSLSIFWVFFQPFGWKNHGIPGARLPLGAAPCDLVRGETQWAGETESQPQKVRRENLAPGSWLILIYIYILYN